MIWNTSIECMDRESMRKLQGERLRNVVEHVYHNCAPYRERMQTCMVKAFAYGAGSYEVAKTLQEHRQ